MALTIGGSQKWNSWYVIRIPQWGNSGGQDFMISQSLWEYSIPKCKRIIKICKNSVRKTLLTNLNFWQMLRQEFVKILS